MSTTSEPTVLTRRQGRIGRITLNRPKALNAIDLGMIERVAAALNGWRDDPAVHAVVIEGAGGRAFCAGGDVRDVRRMALDADHDGIRTFFSTEYAVNLAIARYPKPYIALIDGICMGGGIGLSVHGDIRVASEKAMFAMPETAIALFPDIGATFILPRLRGDWGMYLALTGARVDGPEAVWLGLATHLVPHERMATLADEISEHGIGAIAEAAQPLGPIKLATQDVSAFAADSVAAILARLEATPGPFSNEALATIRQMSPSAVLWSHALVRAGADRTLEQCLEAELAMTRHAPLHPDFIEGVRAMVVDKDRNPSWSPATLEQVDPAAIAAMLA